MGQQIAGATEPDSRTGWRRVDIWTDDGGGTVPDDAVGEAFSVRYELPGTPLRFELSYWVEYGPAMNQPGTPMRYTVEGRWEAWREVDGDQADYDSGYDEGSVYFYDSLEDAEREARRLAHIDQSFAISWTDKV